MLLRLQVAALLIGFTLCSSAQDGTVDVNLTAAENGEVVQLAWRMSAGQTCNGIDILRSIDGLNFNVIGDIQGVCGSPDVAVSFSFTDESPEANRRNYYRLQLGNLGLSNIVSLEVVDVGNAGMLIRPNPMYEGGTIFFQNDNGEIRILRLFDLSGKEILNLQTGEDQFEIRVANLDAGLYPFTISQNDGTILLRDKIVVQSR